MKNHTTTSFVIALSAFLILALTGCGPNQKELAEIAKISNGDGVGVTAVVKLTDQTLLADVVLNANADNIRKAAFEKLTDQRVLADVAKNTKNERIRVAALGKSATPSEIVLATIKGGSLTQAKSFCIGDNMAEFIANIKVQAAERFRAKGYRKLSFIIEREEIRGDVAIVDLRMRAEGAEDKVELQLVKVNGGWKIEKLKSFLVEY